MSSSSVGSSTVDGGADAGGVGGASMPPGNIAR